MTADFSFPSIDGPVNGDCAREIAGICAKQTGEIAKAVDCGGDVAAKIGPEPVG